MKDAAPSLYRIVASRIIWFSALAMFAQLVGVVVEYRRDSPQLARHAIEREATLIFAGVRRNAGGEPMFSLPAELRQRYGASNGAYFARVRNADGKILFANCPGDCEGRFLPSRSPAQEFWVIRISGEPLAQLAGGRAFGVGDDRILIDIAVENDTSGVLVAVLAHEVFDHMTLPMSLMLIVVLGATTLSIRRALRPVADAADRAARLDPARLDQRLGTAGLPREIAILARAVDSGFDKAADLLRAQKTFAGAISHEVRTPLAIAKLELEKIDDPRARNVEKDLDALNRLVEQLTTLARLEGFEDVSTEMINAVALAEAVVASFAPLVYESGKTIELVDSDAKPFRGYATLVENAVRNLAENALQHSDPGTAIVVEVGPGPQIGVRHEAPRSTPPGRFVGEHSKPGLGLQIVRRIAQIHGADFEFATSAGEVRAALKFKLYDVPSSSRS
jgi:signal transduction histidine kinase